MIAVTVCVALASAATTAYAVLGTSAPRPAFAIGVPSAIELHRGQSATIAIELEPRPGFSDPVTLSVPPLPSGVTGGFTLDPVSASIPRSIFIVSAGRRAALTTTRLRITGESGGVRASAVAELSVTPSPRSRFTLAVPGGPVTVTAGSRATATVEIHRVRLRSAIALGIERVLGRSGSAGFPVGVSASFAPNPVPGPEGSTSTLTLVTSASTPPGAYRFAIAGHTCRSCGGAGTPRRPHRRRSFRTAVGFTLVVVPAAGNFEIAGDADAPLYPGAEPVPIDLVFTNPNAFTIYVTDVTVGVEGTSAGTACGADDFVATGFSFGTGAPSVGIEGVPVPPHGTQSLSGAGVPTEYWPTIRMLDSGADQDACEAASVSLLYTDGLASAP